MFASKNFPLLTSIFHWPHASSHNNLLNKAEMAILDKNDAALSVAAAEISAAVHKVSYIAEPLVIIANVLAKNSAYLWHAVYAYEHAAVVSDVSGVTRKQAVLGLVKCAENTQVISDRVEIFKKAAGLAHAGTYEEQVAVGGIVDNVNQLEDVPSRVIAARDAVLYADAGSALQDSAMSILVKNFDALKITNSDKIKEFQMHNQWADVKHMPLDSVERKHAIEQILNTIDSVLEDHPLTVGKVTHVGYHATSDKESRLPTRVNAQNFTTKFKYLNPFAIS